MNSLNFLLMAQIIYHSFWTPIEPKVPVIPAEDGLFPVVRILDGDTFKTRSGGKLRSVRLNGIDTPESKQAYGSGATAALYNLIAGKNVRLEDTCTDRYGRIVAMVYVDNILVNAELIKLGAAWCYPKYCPSEYLQKFMELQYAAQAAKVGLWAASKPLAPWVYRSLYR